MKAYGLINVNLCYQWSNISNIGIGTTNTYDGASNSASIMAQSGHTTSAAMLCDNYTNDDYGTGIYGDWYFCQALHDVRKNMK